MESSTPIKKVTNSEISWKFADNNNNNDDDDDDDGNNKPTTSNNRQFLISSSSSKSLSIIIVIIIIIIIVVNIARVNGNQNHTATNLSTTIIENSIDHDSNRNDSHSLMSQNSSSTMEFPHSLRIIASSVCATVLMFGVVGNLFVPLVVCRQRDTLSNNSTNIFLINLSIADLLVLIVCTPTVLIELHSKPEIWTLGEFMCKTVPFVELVVAHGSVLTILAISFERYYAICKPLKANYKCTNRRAIMTICGLWTVAIIATIPILFGTELVDAIYVDGSIVSACITKANTTWQRLYFIVSIIGFFALPLVILIVVYCIITKRLVRDDRRLLIASIHSTLATSGSIMADGSDCKKLRSGSLPQQFIQQSSLSNESTCGTTITMNQSSIWHHPAAMFLFRGSIASLGANSRRGSTSGPVASNLNQQQQQQQPRRNSSVIAARSVARSRRQVIIMLAAVVICFFLCLLPFRLFTLWLVLVTEEEIRALSMERFYQLLYFCRVMIYVNSMLNPLLYAVVSSKFRRAFVDTIKQLFNNCCFCDFCGCCWWSWWWCALWIGKQQEHQQSNQSKFHHNHHHHYNRINRRQPQKHRTATGTVSQLLNFNQRRHRLFLMRQSTTLTTTTTTTTASSSVGDGSLKQNSSIRSTATNCFVPVDSNVANVAIMPHHPFSNVIMNNCQQIAQNSFDSIQSSRSGSSSQYQNRSCENSSSDATGSVIIVATKKESPQPFSSSSSSRLMNKIYSSEHTAEYRRKRMMKRSSRVSIIDDQPMNHHHQQQQTQQIVMNNTDDNEKMQETISTESTSIIEEILNDPKFVTYESYV
nr:5-hydroxytryptamine receptor 1A-alpha-like [Dermatophagoides farinae]